MSALDNLKPATESPYFRVSLFSHERTSLHDQCYNKGHHSLATYKEEHIQWIDSYEEGRMEGMRTPCVGELSGVGAIRAAYFHELAAGTLYSSFMRETRHYNTSNFVNQNRHRDGEEWLLHDALLSLILDELGTSWQVVENAIFEGFRSALPPAFLQLKENNHDAALLLNWQRTWSDVWWLRSSDGQKISKAAKTLYDAAAGFYDPNTLILNDFFMTVLSPLSPRDFKRFPLTHRAMSELKNIVELQKKEEQINAAQRKMTSYQTYQRSPLVNAVLIALVKALWAGVDYKRDHENSCFTRIVNARYSSEHDLSQVPDEFWMLIADILFHLPICHGLPDAQYINDPGIQRPPDDPPTIPPPMWKPITSESCRLRYLRKHVRKSDI